MELNELHILDGAFRTVDHRNAVARGHERIGRGLIHRTDASRSHQRHFRQESADPSRNHIHDIGAVAGDVRCLACHRHAQMVLCQELNRKMMFVDRNVRMTFYRTDQAGLNLRSGTVFMVQDPRFRMAALLVQVEIPFFVFVEIYAPADQLFNLSGCFTHHLFDGRTVAHEIACNHRIFDMFFKVIDQQVRHRCHPALRKKRVRLF